MNFQVFGQKVCWFQKAGSNIRSIREPEVAALKALQELCFPWGYPITQDSALHADNAEEKKVASHSRRACSGGLIYYALQQMSSCPLKFYSVNHRGQQLLIAFSM